jgi:C_GCAxxG_C_C family probable redox protein
MTDTEKNALEHFKNGLYCSQAVLGVFCEKYGLPKDVAFKISCGLNSGCRCGDICGAVSGAILVIGLKHGDSKVICNSKTEEFINAFKDKNESVICRVLLGYDISTPKGLENFFEKKLFQTVCAKMVKDAVQILENTDY